MNGPHNGFIQVDIIFGEKCIYIYAEYIYAEYRHMHRGRERARRMLSQKYKLRALIDLKHVLFSRTPLKKQILP